MWYAVYNIATGALASKGTVVADPLPDGLASLQVGETEPSGNWNPATLVFEAPVDTLPATWTRYQFLTRMTMQERVAIRTLAQTDAIAADFMHLLDASGDVVRANPDVLAGLNYLASKGVLASGRPSEILNG